MHPDDAAECVAEEVERLRERLRANPELRCDEPELSNRFELRVPFTKAAFRKALPVDLPILMPGGQGFVKTIPVKIDHEERDLVLRSFCDNYDEEPISAELLLPDGSPLPDQEWPKRLGPGPIIRGHEQYDRPFFCRRGLREYHSHPEHEDNPWDRHRESIRIDDIIPELIRDLQTQWDFW